MTPGDRLPRDVELPHSHRILEKVSASDSLPGCAPCWVGPVSLSLASCAVEGAEQKAWSWWLSCVRGALASPRATDPGTQHNQDLQPLPARPAYWASSPTPGPVASPGRRENGTVSFPRGLGEAYCHETQGSRCCLAPNPHKGSDTSGGEGPASFLHLIYISKNFYMP